MSNVYLITGFPGFIASYLVQLLLSRKSGKIYLLVLPQFMEKAQNQLPAMADHSAAKYEAEVSVRQWIEEIPVTIIRPGIVRGRSRNGETIKFDGPYFILNFLDRLRFLPYISYLGSGKAEGNFVPFNYVLEAAVHLGHAAIGSGKTYHLTDPRPYPMSEVYRMAMARYLGREPIWRMKAKRDDQWKISHY